VLPERSDKGEMKGARPKVIRNLSHNSSFIQRTIKLIVTTHREEEQARERWVIGEGVKGLDGVKETHGRGKSFGDRGR